MKSRLDRARIIDGTDIGDYAFIHRAARNGGTYYQAILLERATSTGLSEIVLLTFARVEDITTSLCR